MDIAHLGERTASELLERELISDPGDIYALTPDDIAKLAGFKDKSITNLLEAINASRDRPIDRLLYGFGIRHVGATAARLLADAFGWIDLIAAAPVEELAAVDGVGEVIARAAREFFQRPATKTLLDKLRQAGVRMSEERKKTVGPLTGKSFVITGTLEKFSREEAEQRIAALGGKVTSSLSKKTDYLVVGASPDPSSKRRRSLASIPSMKLPSRPSLAPRNGFAVELSFDPRTDGMVRGVWNELAREGIDDFMVSFGVHPHISLGVFDELIVEKADPEIASFAKKLTPVPVILSSVGVFAGDAGVVFFGAVVTDELLAAHAELHRRLDPLSRGAWPYYARREWVPHCTLTQDMPVDRIPARWRWHAALHYRCEARSSASTS